MASRAFFTAASSREARNSFSRLIWLSRTAVLSTARMSIGASFSRRYSFRPMIFSSPESMRACLRADASSIRIFGMPVSMALAIPPSFSISWMCSQALCAISLVRVST